MSEGPAPLTAQHTDKLLTRLANLISKSGMGISVVEDHNGAYGTMGQTYITVRFHDEDGDFIEVGMVMQNISSYREDVEKRRLDNEDK